MARRGTPEVNAGSMADIAFLLLIFFLVTTDIAQDSGLNRKLPPIDDSQTEPPVIKQKNIFTVSVNNNNQLLVEDELMQLKDLRQAAIDFLDNGAGENPAGEKCNYCNGKKLATSSDHPEKAIISLKNDRGTSYDTYISVQNELVAAYNQLRNVRAEKLYGMSFVEMQDNYKQAAKLGLTDKEKEKLKEKLEKIKLEYPQKLSEVYEKKS